MTQSELDRMIDIVVTCDEGGFALPLHPATIVQLEDLGYVVDLATGSIFQHDGIAPSLRAALCTSAAV